MDRDEKEFLLILAIYFFMVRVVYPSSLWNETIIIDPIRDQDQSQRRAVLDGGRSFVRSESVVEIYSNRRVQEPPPPSPYPNIIG